MSVSKNNLDQASAAARDALAKLREHDGGTRYNGDDDDAGERACCLVASWQPHDSDCPHAVAVAEFDNLLAALDAQVPAGYVLVPVEPTQAMLNAARDWSLKKYGQAVGNDGARGCYAAMLAAANKENSND